MKKSDIEIINNLIQASENRVKGEIKNDILVFKDQILEELVKIREDFTMMEGYRDQLEAHEERISRLKSSRIQ